MNKNNINFNDNSINHIIPLYINISQEQNHKKVLQVILRENLELYNCKFFDFFGKIYEKYSIREYFWVYKFISNNNGDNDNNSGSEINHIISEKMKLVDPEYNVVVEHWILKNNDKSGEKYYSMEISQELRKIYVISLIFLLSKIFLVEYDEEKLIVYSPKYYHLKRYILHYHKSLCKTKIYCGSLDFIQKIMYECVENFYMKISLNLKIKLGDFVNKTYKIRKIVHHVCLNNNITEIWLYKYDNCPIEFNYKSTVDINPHWFKIFIYGNIDDTYNIKYSYELPVSMDLFFRN